MVLRPRALPPERLASVCKKNTALMPGNTGLFARSAITERLGLLYPDALVPSSKVSRKRIGAWFFRRCSVCGVRAMGALMQPLRLKARASTADATAKNFMCVQARIEAAAGRVSSGRRAPYNKMLDVGSLADKRDLAQPAYCARGGLPISSFKAFSVKGLGLVVPAMTLSWERLYSMCARSARDPGTPSTMKPHLGSSPTTGARSFCSSALSSWLP